MKGLKIFAWVVGTLAVLLAVVLALAFTPAVQTWAVRKAVAGQPGMTLEVDRVAAGLSAADIGKFRYAKDGIVITGRAVTARYSAWDYLTKKRINADSVVVEDVEIDLRNATPAAAKPGAPAPGAPDNRPASTPAPQKPAATAQKPTSFEGLLQQAKLPFDIRVASLKAKGKALLPNAQTVTFDLTGVGIETGQRGKLDWTVDFSDATPGAALRALRTTGNAGVHIAADRRIDLIEVDAVAAAIGPKLPPDRVKLVAKAEQPTAGGNEGYAASVALLRGNNTETIFKTSAQYLANVREIAGAWELSIRSEQLAAVLAGLGLPEVAANGAGKFNLKPETNAVSASGDLQGQASQLAKLSPSLEAIGAVHFKTTFDGGLAGESARLEKLELEITGLDGRRFAQISSLQKVTYGLTDKKVTLATPGAEVARISLQELPLAWAQPLAKPMTIESGDLSLTLAIEAEPDGSRIRARATEPLTVRTVTVRDANKKALVEKVTLTTRPSVDYSSTRVLAQLADLNVSMPGGDSLSGNIRADVTNLTTKPAIAFSTQLQGKIVNLLKPYLPLDPGPLSLTTQVEGRMEGELVEIAKSTTVVNRDGGAMLSSTELLQPLRLNTKTSAISVANGTAPAVRVRLGEVPLAWAEAFVAKSKFSGALTGATLEVSLRSVDDLTLNTTQPIALRGVTAVMDGKPMVQGLDLSADLTATKRGDSISYEVRRVDVKQGEASLASLNVAGEAKLGTKLTLVAKGQLDADAAALMKQPVAASFASLTRGRVTATFEANVADAMQAKAAIAAKNLVAKLENRPLGDLELTLTANMKADGSGTVSLPLTLTNGPRKSDLAINGAFGKAAQKDTFLFTGKIAGNQIVVDDFQALAALAPAGESAPANAPATTTSPTSTPSTGSSRPTATTPRTSAPPVATTPAPGGAGRDTAPFWKAVNGKLEVDIKRALYGKDYVVSGIRGNAVITENKLSLDGLEGRFKENPFKLAAGITFSAQAPKPYSLTAAADVQNLDIGEILRAKNPSELPAFETKATLTSRLNGNGGTVGELFKNAFGKFELTGTQGITRILARSGVASTLTDVASVGLAILGARKNSEGYAAAAELTQLLKEVRFDSVKVHVERAPDLSFKLTSIEILSPILHTSGSGTVASKSADDVADAPMNIVLQLGAKGALAHALEKNRLLSQRQDEMGYLLMERTFTIGGTPSKVDNSALWKILLEAGIGSFLNR